MNKTSIRITADIILAVSVVNGWWFVIVPIGIIGAWNYLFFIEILLVGIIYDSLFGFVPSMGIWGYVGSIISVVILIGVLCSKKVLRR